MAHKVFNKLGDKCDCWVCDLIRQKMILDRQNLAYKHSEIGYWERTGLEHPHEGLRFKKPESKFDFEVF